MTTILEDMEQHKDFFSDEESLEKYLDSRYLKNTNEQTINDIFKGLWGITFNCGSDQCKSNRKINFRVLKILYNRYKPILLKFIEENPIHFNKINKTEHGILIRLTEIFGDFPELYDFMESHTKTRLNSAIKAGYKYKVRSPFLSESMEKHFKYLENELHFSEYTFEERFYLSHILSSEEKKLLYRWAEEDGCIGSYYHLLIKQFAHSPNYRTADIHFSSLIEGNLDKFEREHFLAYFEAVNDNRQLYGRGSASYENSIVKRYADKKIGSDFDYHSKFSNVEFDE